MKSSIFILPYSGPALLTNEFSALLTNEFTNPWSRLCLRQNLGHPLEIFPSKGLANMPWSGGSVG